MDRKINRALELNNLGIIPGPKEPQEEFFQRAEYCLLLKKQFQEKIGENFPLKEVPLAKSCQLMQALDQTKKTYEISPNWVPVFFSNYQLSPWQGGCAWIFRRDKNSPKSSLIQLRYRFKERDKYLYFYRKEELLSHELCHAGRLAFEEPKFEEFFAYGISSSSFRKAFGPLIKSSYESLFFILLLLFLLILDFSLVFTGSQKLFYIASYLKLLPLFILIAALARLWIRHRQLKSALKKLEKILCDKKKAKAVLFRMTDREIIAFSRKKLSEIKNYIKKQKEEDFRWKVIDAAYF